MIKDRLPFCDGCGESRNVTIGVDSIGHFGGRADLCQFCETINDLLWDLYMIRCREMR